jgi:hypothetical protein
MSSKDFIVKNGAYISNGNLTVNGAILVLDGVDGITLGNSTVNATINSTSYSGIASFSGGTPANTTNPDFSVSIGVGANVNVNTSSIDIGNSTVYALINSSSLSIFSNAAILVPIGNTGNRPTPSVGLIRYNVDIGGFEGSNSSAYAALGGNVASLTANNSNYLGGINALSFGTANNQTQVLTDSSTISWNLGLGIIATLSLTGNAHHINATSLPVGTCILHLLQANGGNNVPVWSNVFVWSYNVAPTCSTSNGAHDILSFVSDGTFLYGSFLPHLGA